MTDRQFKWAALFICLTGATVIAATGHDGWGWLVFLAFLIMWNLFNW